MDRLLLGRAVLHFLTGCQINTRKHFSHNVGVNIYTSTININQSDVMSDII